MQKKTLVKCTVAALACAFAASYVSAAPHIGKEYRLKQPELPTKIRLSSHSGVLAA